MPGKLSSARTKLLGADTVLPIVAGYKVAARITHNGHSRFAHKVEHVFSEAVFVAERIFGLIDALVYCSAQVLEERAVYSLVDFSDNETSVNYELCFLHNVLPLFNCQYSP